MQNRYFSRDLNSSDAHAISERYKQLTTMSKEPNKKEIKKRAKQILESGIPKQEAYEQLIKEFQNQRLTAEVLERIPSRIAVTKYGFWNNTLLGTILLSAGITLFTNPSVGSMLWYGLFIISVIRKDTRYYHMISIMSILGIIVALVVILMSDSGKTNWLNIGVLMVFTLPSCYIPIWLTKKLTPAPTEERENYTNENGEQRSWMKPTFVEE